jgi:anti-anti-sigma factor
MGGKVQRRGRSMQYQLSTLGDQTVVALRDRFTVSDVDHFRSIVDELPGGTVHSVVFDLSALEFIDSTALGLLVLVRDNAASRRMVMSVRSPRGQVKKAFDVLNFESLFRIEP